MAGGKETPRQKMIGMMYLVLTALLALNVSKQIINAFVTLNNNIKTNNILVSKSNENVFGTFQGKLITLRQQEASEKLINRVTQIQSDARQIRNMTQRLSNFYVSEAGDMIEKVEAHPEGGGWIRDSKELDPIGGAEDKVWKELKPIKDISAKTNYDVPTHLFVGGNLQDPVDRGLEIVNRLHNYRDSLIMKISNYEKNGETFSYEPVDYRPELKSSWKKDTAKFQEIFANANPSDISVLKDIFKLLTVPKKVKNHNEEYPWISGQFDHSPVVASVAAFTSIRSRLFQAEAKALKMLQARVDVQAFNFNKIEPLAFSKRGYINQGDSLDMRVLVAAYDTTSDMKLRYWVNDSTRSPENKQTFKGNAQDALNFKGDKTGKYNVEGDIAVKIKGTEQWKPWDFTYKVGKPTGSIALPEMLTLYKGYENKIKVAASGYDPDQINASCSGCASFSKSGEFYIAKPPLGGNSDISISVTANTESGTKSIAQETLSVTDFPSPTIFLSGTKAGKALATGQIAQNPKVFLKLVGSPLQASFSVQGFDVVVGDRQIHCNGNRLSGEALNRIGTMQPGSQLVIQNVQYSGTGTNPAISGNFEMR